MFFKSYDGWKSAMCDAGFKKILAHFTKADGEIVRYNVAALRRMKEKPSGNMVSSDKDMVARAFGEGPSYFKSYDGWMNFGRGGKRIMMAHFTKASGQPGSYNMSGLENLRASPPPKFSPYDRVILETAIADGPVRR